MALSQFELRRVIRCPAVDEEGFSCLLAPSHEGVHKWNRCETTDREGHRCMFSLKHSGSHEPPWYDRAATSSKVHVINYSGTEGEMSALADLAEPVAARYGWVAQSRSFRSGLPWRLALLRPLASKFTTNGRLTVVFERVATESRNIG
jgi:hypothetical protein